jgi:hypothetical protein
MEFKTKLEAIESLAQCDHGILKGDYARAIGKMFDFIPRTYRIQDNRSEFKGAYFPDLKEGEWAEDVIDASILAESLCNHLKIEYTPMFGRGFALRECCRALKEYCSKG